MNSTIKPAIAWSLLGLCIVQIAIFIYKYFDVLSALDSNPLLSKATAAQVGNFTIGICLIYFLAMLPNIYYIIKRRNFRVACALSVMILLVSRIFLPQITEWFN